MDMRAAQNRKHIPVRMCVICRKKADKRSLNRVVLTAEGLQVDRTGKLKGRGAYVCDSPSCWEKALHTTVLDKALRASLTDDDRKGLSEAYNQQWLNHDRL